MYKKKTFWAGLGERAIKTAAQTLAASLTLGTVLWGVDWVQVIGVTATATLLSVLTSLADPQAADTATTTGA